MDEGRRGIWFGVAAYLLWGLFPLYWTVLEPAGALEILGHRIVWSLLVTLLVIASLRRRGLMRASLRERRAVLV
ncbi:MAG: EamA family transporter RarD, partial [Geodermatophilaceae bacterium]|nr:EamA family transporter RarD [Geodermatophilaceae bacterium]